MLTCWPYGGMITLDGAQKIIVMPKKIKVQKKKKRLTYPEFCEKINSPEEEKKRLTYPDFLDSVKSGVRLLLLSEGV